MQNTKLPFTLTKPDEPTPTPDEGEDNVVPADPSDSATPTDTEETIATPDTGFFTASSKTTQNTIAAFAVILATLVFAIIIINKLCRKKVKFGKVSKSYDAGKLLIIPILLAGALLATTFKNQSFADTDEIEYADTTAPANIELAGELDKEGNTFSFTKATITMNDATNYGFELYALAGADSLAPKTEDNETTISSIEEAGPLSANTYGYTLQPDAKPEDEWYPLSTIASSFYSTKDSTTAETATDIYFGILTNKDAAPDTYELDLDFYGTKSHPTLISQLTYMQEFKSITTDDLATIKGNMVKNQQYQLKDSRDQKIYYVAMLNDGNVWMTQNLDHDIVTDTNYYTPENTDIPENWVSIKATYATGDGTYIDTSTEPESYDPGDICWDGESSSVACTQKDSHYHLGNYYNWTAAVAMNDSSMYNGGNSGAPVNQSICPAGWRLPVSSGSKSYPDLVSKLNLTAGENSNIQLAPVFFPQSGYWRRGVARNIGADGGFWSSYFSNGDNAYRLFYSLSTGCLNENSRNARVIGYSVRCVAY